jgi:hypothetical protein
MRAFAGRQSGFSLERVTSRDDIEASPARRPSSNASPRDAPFSPTYTPGRRVQFGSVIRADTAALLGISTPQFKKSYPLSHWLLDFKKSPLQPTARISPCTFLLRVFFCVLLFLVISSTLPISAVSSATAGVQLFVETITYERLGGQEGTLSTVTTLDDVVLYSRALVSALLPAEAYANQTRSEVPYLLRVDRLMNSIVVAQRRVDGSNCAYENMRDVYPECFGSLDENERRESFDGHKYDADLGGVYTKLPLRREEALDHYAGLENAHFWDRATRESSVRFAFFNANGPFSGYCIVKFTLSPFGNVESEVDTRWLRLQPYAKEANGGTLVFYQVGVGIMLLLLIAENVFHAANQPHVRYKLAYLLRPHALMDYAILLLVYLALEAWTLYISGPERKNFDPNAPGFGQIIGLAGSFQRFMFFMSMLVLFAAVRLSEYMVLVDELANIYVSVANALGDMAWFGIFFGLLFTGFVLSGHVLFGTDLPMFGTLESTASNLMLWLIALGGGYRALFEKPGGLLYLGLFLFICLILVLNILMALLLVAFNPEEKAALKSMKFEEEDRPYNHALADAICDLCMVSSFHGDLYKGHAMDEDEDGDGTYDDQERDAEKAPLISKPTQEEDSDGQ